MLIPPCDVVNFTDVGLVGSTVTIVGPLGVIMVVVIGSIGTVSVLPPGVITVVFSIVVGSKSIMVVWPPGVVTVSGVLGTTVTT